MMMNTIRFYEKINAISIGVILFRIIGLGVMGQSLKDSGRDLRQRRTM